MRSWKKDAYSELLPNQIPFGKQYQDHPMCVELQQLFRSKVVSDDDVLACRQKTFVDTVFYKMVVDKGWELVEYEGDQETNHSWKPIARTEWYDRLTTRVRSYKDSVMYARQGEKKSEVAVAAAALTVLKVPAYDETKMATTLKFIRDTAMDKANTICQYHEQEKRTYDPESLQVLAEMFELCTSMSNERSGRTGGLTSVISTDEDDQDDEGEGGEGGGGECEGGDDSSSNDDDFCGGDDPTTGATGAMYFNEIPTTGATGAMYFNEIDTDIPDIKKYPNKRLLIFTGNGLFPQKAYTSRNPKFKYLDFQTPEGVSKVYGRTHTLSNIRDQNLNVLEMTLNIVTSKKVFGGINDSLYTVHGSLTDMGVVTSRDDTIIAHQACIDWLEKTKQCNPTDISKIVLVGINCSGVNGLGFPKFIKYLQDANPQVEIVIVNPDTDKAKKLKWMRERGINTDQIEYRQMTAEDYFERLKRNHTNTVSDLPSKEELNDSFGSRLPDSKWNMHPLRETNDLPAMQLYNRIVLENKFNADNTGPRTRAQKINK